MKFIAAVLTTLLAAVACSVDSSSVQPRSSSNPSALGDVPPASGPISVPVAPPPLPAGAGWTFPNTGFGSPARPQFVGSIAQMRNWDLMIHQRDEQQWDSVASFPMQHGDSCDAPPATHWAQTVAGPDGGVMYTCRNHLMTAIANSFAGYAVELLTVPQMMDFSKSESVFSFSMSTLHLSEFTWVEFWVQPFAQNLVLPRDELDPDGAGTPKNAIEVRMGVHAAPQTDFGVSVFRDFAQQELPTPGDFLPLESVVVPSAIKRANFELHLSSNHVKFGLPPQPGLLPPYDQSGAWWADSDIAPLPWSRGLVSFGNTSYDACGHSPCVDPAPAVDGSGAHYPDTWHWSDFQIRSTAPVHIVRPDQSAVDGRDGSTTVGVSFSEPAPAGGFLRFSGWGKIELSFDGGNSFMAGSIQPSSSFPKGQPGQDSDYFANYFTPVPQGTSRVVFRGTRDNGSPWRAEGISILSER